jgi:hypothetical protein
MKIKRRHERVPFSVFPTIKVKFGWGRYELNLGPAFLLSQSQISFVMSSGYDNVDIICQACSQTHHQIRFKQ